jgi:SNF2 family DNA or RNA helicase
MSITAEAPMKSLFHSPWGLFPFQMEHVVLSVLRPNNLLCHDTGLGKGVSALATAALLFEDGVIDHTIIVCEAAKLYEWVEDVERFTDLTAVLYAGDPSRREKIRLGTLGRKGMEPTDLPQVIIGSFDTLKLDLVTKAAVDSRQLLPGPLLELLSGKSVLVVFDETTKLARRSSGNHRAHKFAVEHWRQRAGCRVMALTATPMERNPESYFNLGRIICPETMPTVEEFNRLYVSAFGFTGEPSAFKNLEDFALRFGHVLLRKRKTDDDVRQQFPSMSETFRYVPLGSEHQKLYSSVSEAVHDLDDPVIEQAAFNTLRQLAGHPMSLLGSEGAVGSTIVSTMGVDGLEHLGSAKRDLLLADLHEIIAQGERVIVFTYFPSIIKPLLEDLTGMGISVGAYHGGMTQKQKEASKTAFKEGRVSVFLASSSAEKGINLPEAGYVINYDLPSKHSSYLQRINRASRIGSNAGGLVVVKSYIAKGTVEEGIAGLWINRNHQQDALTDADVDDDDRAFVSADDRKRILRSASKIAAPV